MSEEQKKRPRVPCRLGCIRVPFRELLTFSGVSIDHCNTQGELQEKGVFDAIHAYLHLPQNYSIRAIFMRPMQFIWHIVIESDSLPDVPEGYDIPEIVPTYKDDKLVYLTVKVYPHDDIYW